MSVFTYVEAPVPGAVALPSAYATYAGRRS